MSASSSRCVPHLAQSIRQGPALPQVSCLTGVRVWWVNMRVADGSQIPGVMVIPLYVCVICDGTASCRVQHTSSLQHIGWAGVCT